MILLERDLLLQKIFSRINAQRPQSISITGDLKIGKTVLLEQILNADIQKKYIDHSKKYCFYYKNLAINQSSHLDLIKDIICSFKQDINQELLTGDNVYNTLTEIISENQNETTFIIVLDNFNVLTNDVVVPLEFFSFLRSLANSYHVAYIISSVCALQEMCASKEVTESPFFNIFTNIELKPFSEDEGAKLLSLYDASEFFLVAKKLSGLHPFLIQQTVKLLQDLPRPQNPENTKRQLVENNKQFVVELLRNFPDQYPQFLINLALGIKPPEKEFYILSKLIQKGYVSSDFQINSEIIRSVLILLHQKKKNEIFENIKKWLFERR